VIVGHLVMLTTQQTNIRPQPGDRISRSITGKSSEIYWVIPRYPTGCPQPSPQLSTGRAHPCRQRSWTGGTAVA
jgi:hypothetical protein